MEKRTKKPKLIINVIILAVVALGACLIGKFAYDKGKEDGRNTYEAEASESINGLADAVVERSNDIKQLQILESAPSELNEEFIDAYLEALEKIELKNVEAREILKNYQDAWQAMKTTYATGDNEKIKTEFETLKNTAEETAEKLQNLYDGNISSALEKL
ncbi:hypothetical protein IJ103_01535 [Candidatus Saccharibacteria bacterium]|nr:hypothetical protein [Candidatus Saccharibacteria bacterium]